MMSSRSPKVTVFIPVYNREKFIGEALESILGQTFTDFEILVIDDGSTDDSRKIISSFSDPRIRLVCNDQNLGIPKTRNRGLEQAKGEYIALLDSDDRAFPERLAKQVRFLDDHKDWVQVGSWCRMMDSEGHPLKRVKRQPVSSEDVDVQLLFRCAISNRSIMGRTKILREFGYRENFPRCQDYDLHVRLAKTYRIGNIPECLVYGRIHPQQITIQTTSLGDEKKKDIIGSLLKELQVPFQDPDLDAHLNLSRMRKMNFQPTIPYIKWATDWLPAILEGNAKVGRYSQRALLKAIWHKWAKAYGTATLGTKWQTKSSFVRLGKALLKHYS